MDGHGYTMTVLKHYPVPFVFILLFSFPNESGFGSQARLSHLLEQAYWQKHGCRWLADVDYIDRYPRYRHEY